jgi:adenylosuccinate synthase
MFSGKTTIAGLLNRELHYVVLSARSVIRELAGEELASRADLQRFGAALEERTRGRWLGEAAADVAKRHASSPIVVDAARTLDQVASVRRALGSVEHVHLTAPREELKSRFERRTNGLAEPPLMEEAAAHPIEQAAMRLGATADLVLDSACATPHALLQILIAYLQD